MKFEKFKARSNWRARADEAGYLASILDNPPYWVEALEEPFCGVLTLDEVENCIEMATAEIYERALEAVDFVVNGARSEEWFDRLAICPTYRNAIRRSWRRADHSIYGRFDFSYNDGVLKLLELNFDTPTSIYEAAVLQWFWLEDLKNQGSLPGASDQFNSLHERLIGVFAKVGIGENKLHLCSVADAPEDEDTVRYLQSCAMQAGLDTRYLLMTDVGVDNKGRLVDTEGKAIRQLFKLYPWEFIMYEDQGFRSRTGKYAFPPLIEANAVRFLEPSWKLILSNKAILPLLWHLFPDHKFLLPAAFDDDSPEAKKLRRAAHVRKPIFGREGGSVSIVDPNGQQQPVTNESWYGREGFVLQSLHALPTYQGYHVVLGSWVIDGQPAGLGMRADRSPITSNTAIFVPHYIQN